MMRILFISSGNSENGISPIIYNQGQSLIKAGESVEYFTIKGKGLFGYFKFIPQIWKHLKQNKYDIIHAHYSLSAFAASLAGAKPLVVSLMGSDVKAKFWYKWIIYIFYKCSWSKTIVKSEEMKTALGLKKVQVIPNGVDFSVFYHMDKKHCQQSLGWDPTKTHILFPSNPKRFEKNYQLLEKSLAFIEDTEIIIHALVDVPNNKIATYLNAADLIVLTSLWEGSPNVIKEAMTCNKTIVSTNVGDVAWLFGSGSGHFITNFTPEDVANKILLALEYSEKNKETKGRDRIIDLGLDSKSIAKKIITIYKETLNS
jgi:glycosyltransferase involved in cell wall biosynthesis